MKQLEAGGYFDDLLSDSASLTLFKKHFITMNTLYQLQKQYGTEGRYLEVSALQIRLHDIKESSLDAQIAESDGKVSAYYLDWSNFDKATDDSVAEMLSSFWAKFEAFTDQSDAFIVLGLEEGATWQEVQTSYRRLAKQHHPDSGGNTEKFIAVRAAYEKLKQIKQR